MRTEFAILRKAGKKREAPWLDADWRSWYQLERWRRIRREQLRREPLCKFCGLKGIATAATIADHVEPHGGNWTAFITGKLQSLCPPCHDSAKKLHDRRQDLDEDGWPIDNPVKNVRASSPRRQNPWAAEGAASKRKTHQRASNAPFHPFLSRQAIC
jgi:hypothetical protein